VDLPRDENGRTPRGKLKTPSRKKAHSARALADLAQWLDPARQAAE